MYPQTEVYVCDLLKRKVPSVSGVLLLVSVLQEGGNVCVKILSRHLKAFGPLIRIIALNDEPTGVDNAIIVSSMCSFIGKCGSL